MNVTKVEGSDCKFYSQEVRKEVTRRSIKNFEHIPSNPSEIVE